MHFKNKCLFIQHILNVVKLSFHTLMNGNGLNNASGTYYRNWWFLLLCIPVVALFPSAAQIPLFYPKSKQKGNPKKQMWVSGGGSELWCIRYIATSYLSTQFGYEVYRTTDKVYLSAQDCIRSQTHCALILLDHRFKLVSSICVLRKVILSSCFDSSFAIPWARQVTIT